MISEERIREIKNHSWFNNVRGKLEHIQRFLHDGSASAMVGAGYSRNAQHDKNVIVKDWEGLAIDFYKRIYGGNPDKKDLSLKSALRLASQVESQYGRNELDRIIEQAVPNDKLKPGPLHIALVNLPWRDIFTTNYDQLLENTPTRLSYSIVTNKETLLYKSHPRIIKLHGSFPDIKPYVISEEDYRKYPNTHPEFVNTVRQSLIESALCLFGFSGDDPNFLSWIGWIRDKMGEHLAPIYLFDVSDKGYHESELSLLRQRRIEIISMAGFSWQNREEFFEFIFAFLGKNPTETTTEWCVKIPYEVISSIRSIQVENGKFKDKIHGDKLNKLIQTYREIRENYPGWLFMPVKHLEIAFEDSFSAELQNIQQIIAFIPSKEKKALLFELEWRLRMSFMPVSLLPWYAKEVHQIIDGLEKEDILKDYQLVVLCISLMSYHRQRYEIEEFEGVSTLITNVLNSADTDNIRRYIYEKCLCAVSLMDYTKAQMCLSLWSPAPEDYLGILWKSAVLIEIGQFEEAHSLLIKTHNRLQNANKAYNSVNFAYSTIGAYESVIRVLEPFSESRYRINKDLEGYYIYNYFRYEKGKLYDGRDNNDNKSKYRTHEFNLNHVVNHFSINNRNRDSESQFAGRLQMVWESFGYPYLLNSVTINTNMMKLSSDSLICTGNAPFALNVLIRSAQADTIKSVLSKSLVSTIDINVIRTIFDALVDKAEKISDWNHPAIGLRLSIAMTQILRRFSVILDSDRIKKLVPILLKIREYRPREYKNESLRTIFNCLSDNDLCDIFPILACASIETEELDRDIIFPNPDKEVEIPDKAVEIIEKAFDNEDKYVRNNAYLRATRIYKYCSSNQKHKLNDVILKWRIKDMEVCINATYSFNVVPYDESRENVSPLDRIQKSLIKLKEDDTSIQDNDDIVRYTGKADDNLCVLEALVNLIPDNQQGECITMLNQRIERILARTKETKGLWEQAFGHSDKYELITCTYVLARLNYEVIDLSIAREVCIKLIELAKNGYPDLFAIFNINKYAKILTEEDFQKILRNCILSSEEDIRDKAFNFMAHFGFDENENIWRLVWSKIQFSSSPEVSNYLSLVMDTCENHPLILSSISQLPEILKSIKECINNESWLDGDIFDIQYQVMRLLGYAHKCECSVALSEAIKNWIPNNEIPSDLPNDVKLGFYEGIRIWEKHKDVILKLSTNI